MCYGPTTALSALLALREQCPELMLLRFPLHGIEEMIRYVRRNAEWARTRIIVLGNATDNERILALEAGVDDFIKPPVSQPELLARIRAVLRRRNGWVADQIPQRVGNHRVEEAK